MAERLRCFIAIDLPSHVREHSIQLQQGLRQAGVAARWVRPAAMHLTLKFMGDVPLAQLTSIDQGMKAAAAGVAVFSLAAHAVGVFPGVRNARVVWAGLRGQVEKLRQLQQGIDEQLARVGLAREARAFQAHLTLGRFDRAPQPRSLVDALAAFATSKSDPFIVSQVTLYRSQLGPGGANYSVLGQVALAAAVLPAD